MILTRPSSSSGGFSKIVDDGHPYSLKYLKQSKNPNLTKEKKNPNFKSF